MSRRKEVQKAHEDAVLAAALAEHNRNLGTSLTVQSRPDPPDAMLSDGSVVTWLELTDAFFSAEWARDIVGFAADESHRPMRAGLYADMDSQLAGRFCDIVIQKIGKASYDDLAKAHGPGILVVGLETPWAIGDDTIAAIEAEWAARGSPDFSQTFRFIYFGFRDASGNRAKLWRGS